MRLFTFLAGIFVGLILLLGVVLLSLPHLAEWLVVDEQSANVDAIVVLGGGGGSRLRHAVQLYDSNVGGLLILVGEEPDDWQNILRRHCFECNLDQRKHVIINGSLNTMTDAELVKAFVNGKPFNSLLVVTDPYHTRRADLIFKQTLSDVKINTVSSGFYGKLSKPEGEWWRDRRTLELVWVEFGKILYVLVGSYSDL